MNAIVTGSHVYGTPGPNSDVDLVILVSRDDARILSKVHREQKGAKSELREKDGNYDGIGSMTFSLRFGPLNLIVTTDPVQYEVWRRGTSALVDKSKSTGQPIPRGAAVKYFKALREHLKG